MHPNHYITNYKFIHFFFLIIIPLIICLILFYKSFATDNQNSTFNFAPDSPGYISINGLKLIVNPYISGRNFGYPLIVEVLTLGSHAEIRKILSESYKEFSNLYDWRERLNYIIEQLEQRVPGAMARIVYLQFLMYCIAFCILYYSISINTFFINKIFSFSFSILYCFIIYRFPPMSARVILSEPLSISLGILFISFLLLYRFYNQIWLLSISFLCASGAFFIRSNMFAVVLVGAIYLLFLIYQSKKLYILPSFCLLLSFFFIAILSYKSGHISFGAQESWTNRMFYSYYATVDDYKEMPTERALDFHNFFMDAKKNHPLLNDPGFIDAYKNKNYVYVVDNYGWGTTPSIMELACNEFSKKHPEFPLSILNYAILGYELKKGVIKNHWREIIQVIGHGFLIGIGLDTIMPNQPLHVLPSVWIMSSSLLVWITALILCKQARFSLFLLIITHFLSILAICIGHGITPRYIEGTSDIYLVGLALAWICLAQKAFEFFIKTKNQTLTNSV